MVGTIPSELGNCSKLASLLVAQMGSGLTGEVPKEVCQLDKFLKVEVSCYSDVSKRCDCCDQCRDLNPDGSGLS